MQRLWDRAEARSTVVRQIEEIVLEICPVASAGARGTETVNLPGSISHPVASGLVGRR